MLPEVALLEIFGFYVDTTPRTEAWQKLVHVCQDWRNIVLRSPQCLNLRLECDARTLAREKLDIWPPFPIVIRVNYLDERCSLDNVFAALVEQNDRICELYLNPPRSQSTKVLATMQRPFPELTHLLFQPEGEKVLVVPDSFLGGSAPRLRKVWLKCIPFPGLPKLLLSAPHLVYLGLWNIPHSGYFSPEAMVTGLSALTRLETLIFEFDTPRRRRCQHPLPQSRALLPVLNRLQFKGSSIYFEVLVAHIDVPKLEELSISFFHRQMFDTPELTQFIDRTPNFSSHVRARIIFSHKNALVRLPQRPGIALELAIVCCQLDQQLSSLAQICSSSLPQDLITAVKYLDILKDVYSRSPHYQDDAQNIQWLELLRPFAAVKRLYISEEFAPRTTPALLESGGEEVLPALHSLFIEKLPIVRYPYALRIERTQLPRLSPHLAIPLDTPAFQHPV